MPAYPSGPEQRSRAHAVLAALLPDVRARAVAALGQVEGEGLVARLEQHHLDLVEPLDRLYGGDSDLDALIALVRPLVDRVVEAALARPVALRILDRRREVDPGWFQRARMLGYVAYADRFAGDLAGVRERLDYLAELGVTYLHLMPLLRAREGENDGGYAVVDYAAVDPRLGSMADLESLAADLRGRGMALCVDLVLNHTAAEHPWAQAAAAGDPTYRAFYRIYPDRSEPDRYESTLPEVFPDQAPGSFTHVDGVGWVWTTFNSFQWDLDWSNPDVFAAMLGTMLGLADRGVDVLRLDAAPFLWKRVGTDSQNQPEVHLLLRSLRALVTVAAPGVAFKAEAIVAPQQLVLYLGAHERFHPECDLAYHNQLMVLLWSSLATRDVRLARTALSRMRPAPPSTSWVTYLRCHDDIGWAISDEDAWACGIDPHAHRSFLSDFYAGSHPGSFARGAVFQANPRTGDRRISGSAASLCGLEAALAEGDDVETAVAVGSAADALQRRLLLRRHTAAVHGRRAGPAQRPALGGRPGACRRQPLAAPAADGLAGSRPPHRPRHGRGPGLRRPRRDGPGAGRPGLPARQRGPPYCWTSATTGCSVTSGATPAVPGWWRWRPSPTTRSGSLAPRRSPAREPAPAWS